MSEAPAGVSEGKSSNGIFVKKMARVTASLNEGNGYQ